MARIRATCPSCGDVELQVDEVEVWMCTDDEDGEYRFDCPLCATTVSKTAENRTLDLLIASGVRAMTWAQPVERIITPNRAKITYDDLIDFHHLLNDDQALAQALSRITV